MEEIEDLEDKTFRKMTRGRKKKVSEEKRGEGNRNKEEEGGGTKKGPQHKGISYIMRRMRKSSRHSVLVDTRTIIAAL